MRYSIILPVRNGGEYVKECIKSILCQSLDNFNLLVLDNASTDGTVEWIRSLNDKRIKIYLSEKSLTIEENWARIITIPKNEFITLIGHDDALDKNYLSVMDALIIKHPKASLFQAHYRYIDSSGNFIRRCKIMDEVQYAHEFIAHQFLRSIDSTGTGYMMRSEDYDNTGGMPNYPKLIFADYALWITLMQKSYKATAPEECFSYRIHDSISKLTNGEEYQESFEQYIFFLKAIMDENIQIKEVIKRYGETFLLDFCESLSHRILKTARNQRSISVNTFVEKCKSYAKLLIPDQKFDPESKFSIKIAQQIDSTAIGSYLFYVLKGRFHNKAGV